MISRSLFERFYSDPKFNGTRTFYEMVRAELRPEHLVLNLGAGPATKSRIRAIKGEVAEVVGVDIDPVVFENQELDRAFLIENDKIPMPDAYFDVAFSDMVLEHVEEPRAFLAEVHRVLKSGGFYLFRTPNRYHYVTLISALLPHSLHEKIANPARGLPEEAHPPWPTFYRMNSRSELRNLARETGFSVVELRMMEPEPSYLVFHFAPFLLGVAYERLVNSTPLLEDLRVNILGCLRKPAA